jgi:16S rRNA (uracil1498-N3)-methyltransferase
MHRFYLPQKVAGLIVSIFDAGQVHHIKNVLRLKIGEKITIFDKNGDEYLCKIASLGKNEARMDILSRKEVKPEAHKITLACALPKRVKIDEIIDKLTQLGIYAVIPLISERVILKLDENKDNKLDRWRKIALSASEQSQRNQLPQILPVTTFKDILAQSNQYDLKLIPTLEGERINIREVVPVPIPSNILILIGPEGDFSPHEIEQAMQKGFIPISLGENILRVDTAAISVVSYLRFAYC